MSFSSVFGLVILGIVAIALLGPSKLPAGIEQLWLMLGNFRRSQAEMPPLTMEQARQKWQDSENPLYDLVQILYGAVEHLVELRHRIFVVLGVLVVGGVFAALFANQILSLLTAPAKGVPLIVLKPTDMIWVYFEVILSVSAIFALPVLIYETLMFVRPALETPQEISVFKAMAIVGMPMVIIFFIGGVAFAYFIMLPVGLKYLSSFGSDLATPSWNYRDYNSFAMSVLLWIGAAFETPLIMALLARLGLVTPQAMLKQWRYAIVGIAVVAAMITPTVDPVNMALVMGPLLLLYFLGIFFARLVYRPRSQPAPVAE
jgi:sec-independent protein translocase protein TatC